MQRCIEIQSFYCWEGIFITFRNFEKRIPPFFFFTDLQVKIILYHLYIHLHISWCSGEELAKINETKLHSLFAILFKGINCSYNFGIHEFKKKNHTYMIIFQISIKYIYIHVKNNIPKQMWYLSIKIMVN